MNIMPQKTTETPQEVPEVQNNTKNNFMELVYSKRRTIAYSIVLLVTIFLHWYSSPSVTGCSLSYNPRLVSGTFSESRHAWVYRSTVKDAKLIVVLDENGNNNSHAQLALYKVCQVVNTGVNFLIGVWIIKCFPVLMGMEGIIEPIENAMGISDIIGCFLSLIAGKMLSVLFMLIAQIDACNYSLISVK